MITPRFTLSQSDATFTVAIRAPYCNIADLDVSVEENNFIFICKPYYLRLRLPGNILDNDNNTSKFDSDNGEFSFTYEKETRGEVFENLNFITKFLSPKISVTEGNRTIEVLSTEDEGLVMQPVEVDDKNQYGFAMRGGYKFSHVSSEFSGVFDVDPFAVDLKDRGALRLQDELKSFSADHYLCDIAESDEIQEIIHTKCPWNDLQPSEILFTSKQLDFMKDLTNISYNLTEQQTNYCRNGLIDVLYAYCYDKRTTLFESTCESSWTVNKISATLCYFDGFDTAKEAVICAFRRCIIYPLYRNFKLGQQVLKDLKVVLNLGETFIIQCLIDLDQMFLESDSSRYILNNLFVKDYVTYIMKWDSKKWKETVEEVGKVEITKSDLDLNLEGIEKTLDSQDDLIAKMSNVTIVEEEEEELDSDDTDSDCEDS